MKKILVFLSFILPVFPAEYSVTKSTDLSSAAEVITVQQKAAPTKSVQLIGATMYCAVACAVTLERDGTAATGTATTPVKFNSAYAVSAVDAHHTSDVGVGEVLATYNVCAGCTVTIELRRFIMTRGIYSPVKNFSLRTAAITGVATLNLFWEEF